ncbi:MAG TPA: LPS export ABC transporter permease LptG [Telluria sp.]|nr:LPS export ABC transporter permease LptG [Telluria sp.]
MKIVERYFLTTIAQAVFFVLAAFLALTAFMDLTAELPNVGKGGYEFHHALGYVLMLMPGHVYETMPVAALIGTIYAMAQFAASSEFTILRASGMSTRMAAWMLFKIGVIFVGITFIFGELITPRIAPYAETFRLSMRGATVSAEFRSGLWTKDVVRSEGTKGEVVGSRFFNVSKIGNDGELIGLKLYEFDNDLRLRSLTTAAKGTFKGEHTWVLTDVTETRFENTLPLPKPGEPPLPHFGQETSVVKTEKLPSRELTSEITPKILSVSSADPERMSANELAVYTRHLAENRQETDRFKIAFWKKLVDPLAIFVLMAMALPFAYLHTRSGGVSFKIFVGIMIGVAFMLINTLFSHVGMLSALPPFVTAIAPSALFLLLAFFALRWVERH